MAINIPPLIKFRGYVKWYGESDSPTNTEPHIRPWLLKRLPFEVIVDEGKDIDLRDVGESVEGKWSAYSGWDHRNGTYCCGHYFFELETDVMAFKLRWM